MYIYKILREFFRIFGSNNKLYKKYKDKAKLSYSNADKLSKQLQFLEDFAAYILARIDFKQHYNIEIPAIGGSGNKFDYVRIKVGDIKRIWDGKIYSLNQVSPYKYLETGDKKIYENYIKKSIARNFRSINAVWDVKQFDDLYKSIKKYGYDPTKSVICVNENNIIIDGQHRACCLLFLYGNDYEINVVKVSRK